LEELDLNIFPDIPKSTWEDLARKQLKGQDPISALGWKSDTHLELNPYYDQSDTEALNYLSDFFEASKIIEWKLYEQVDVINSPTANQVILEALKGGCDGVILDISNEVQFGELLQNVLTDICDLNVRTDLSLENVPDYLNGFLITKNNSNAIVSSNESQVDSIVELLTKLSDEKYILRTASIDFFLEIASLRALRFLLFEELNTDPWSIDIHTHIPLHEKEDQQWFFNSTAGLASVLGGSSSISFSSAKGNVRTSRNVGNIIREESGIKQYTDQCGGSYYIESLTHKIIQRCKEIIKN
jgi:methylmalonyl-CoA mutase